MNMTLQEFRAMAIALLDDEDGINETAFRLLDLQLGLYSQDISNAVTSTDGRFYLPEDHGLVA